MHSLFFEYPRMVSWTPPGGDPADVTAIHIVAATAYRFEAGGVAVETEQGAATVPYGFSSYRHVPMPHPEPDA